MTGNDAIKIAKRALVWAAAEERRMQHRQAFVAAEEKEGSDGEIASLSELQGRYRSAAASAAGYRRGLNNALQRCLRGGIDRPKLKPLPWENEND